MSRHVPPDRQRLLRLRLPHLPVVLGLRTATIAITTASSESAPPAGRRRLEPSRTGLGRCACYLSAASRLPLGYLSAASRLPLDCISAASRLPLGCLSAASRLHLRLEPHERAHDGLVLVGVLVLALDGRLAQ